MFDSATLSAIRDRFAHVAACPITGPRVFFENAGGALTLKSVVDTTATFAAIPDNQGRANPASAHLVQVIAKARDDVKLLLNAPGGQVIVGESGTEMLYRMIRSACMATTAGPVIGSTLEHPASRSAARLWADRSGREYIAVAHDDATGTVTADHYRPHLRPDLAVATIIHTSPVTGMGVDVAGIAAAIRETAPRCLIIVDGIQHAAHGGIDLAAAGVDGYAISPYKMFSRHGYGVAWISDRLAALPHEALVGGPAENWELGTRDTGAYATLSDVVAYLDWLGAQVSDETAPRARLEAAAGAIHAHEHALCDAMLHGTGNHAGLTTLPGVQIVGGADNPAREGLVSFWIEGAASADIVAGLEARGVRVHIRKADHYSGNILDPLCQSDCVRVSLAHYNSLDEVAQFLDAMQDIAP
ncbi:aminotransferase class V-fold PLP-dependent enzyme [Lutimaribacter sp. EGI FJ00015]|uniref:Aminotransferase class V-fold PLP-dependent enzyme n=1 Tax=Lutimaribacter degradans TaxID=2945989 RepID=A0ACC5ZY49_9RHOB|nr:aminotransferase class V-fold PLP-dependent enzyme [Lutimaribacter sp. EGI FJ00013]MCM2562274.1 aminotransferase class V-fold PLP-dependent enzyme [Lutimaribacter sp. EGI FJ00013]MCO0613429.1 aminotransferase class V-fold PLP-dependent enzyme [Lutimaribacter sp. EGI FJ00015]MCO0636403.1 aminotransferase class V-fold PLP-dependent enzyme [Lutimaribacter sp. EGI FJ00014]